MRDSFEDLIVYSVRINDGAVQSFTPHCTLGAVAVAVAVGTLEYQEAKDGIAVVEIWVEEHLPDYPPMFYEASWDKYGAFKISHLPGCDRRADDTVIMKAYQGRGEFEWYERIDGNWKPLAMWQPQQA